MEAAAAVSASWEDGAVAEAPGDPPGDPAPAPFDGSAPLGQQGEMVQAAARPAGELISVVIPDKETFGMSVSSGKQSGLALIKGVDVGSKAEAAGLRAGDMPVSRGRRIMHKAFVQAIKDGKRPFTFQVLRRRVLRVDPPGDPAPAPVDGSVPPGQQGGMVHVAAQASMDAKDNGEGGAEARRAMIMENIRWRCELLERVRECRRVAEARKADYLLELAAIEEEGGDVERTVAMIEGRYSEACKNESEEEEEEIDGASGRATRAARKRKTYQEYELGSDVDDDESLKGEVDSEDESGHAPPKKKARKKDSSGGNWGENTPRGITQKSSGKWQAQIFHAGKSRYLGVFESKEAAALGYEAAREVLQNAGGGSGTDVERNVGLAQKAARQAVVGASACKSGGKGDDTGSSWDDKLQRLKAYKAKEGDCNVPKRYAEDKQLGKWVSKQRTLYKLRNEGKRSSMTDERLEQLERIGFVWDPQGEQWDDMLTRLKEYKEENDGDCNVPRRNADDKQLGTWVQTQRRQYKLRNEGKPSSMTDERVASLNSIDFDWVYKHPAHKRDVEIVQQFHTRHGHCHVPHPSVTRCSELKSIWPFVCALRKRYRNNKPTPNWILEELSAIGFEFDPPDRRPRDARVETDILHSMGVRYGIVFDTWDVTVDSEDDCRPDSTMYTHKPGKNGEPDSNVAIGAEKDEHRHDGEPVWKEQMKMNKFVKSHEEEYQSINFIRTNSVERKESDPRQEAKLQELIDHIEKVRLPGVHVWYLDYPEDHHHIVASRRRRRTDPDPEASEEWNFPLFDGVHDEWKSGCEPGK